MNYYYYNKNSITSSEKGYGIDIREPKNLLTSGEAAVKRHTKPKSLNFDSNLHILQNLADFANASDDLILIFYSSPVYSSYIKGIDQEQFVHTYNSLNSIVNSNENFFYYNFMNSKDFKKSDFRDGDHLNQAGAEKLSLKLNSILKKHLKN